MPHESYVAPDERRLLARYWHTASGFWRGPRAWRTWLLLFVLVATVLLQLVVQFYLNFWNRDFFNAIERKDSAELWRQALIFLPLAAVSLSLAIASVWGRMTMQRTWRAWLSERLYDYWLERGHYRRLHLMPGEHDSPEYRIAEDARVATDLPIDLTLGLVSATLTAITFIGVLWSVGGGIEIHAFGYNLAIPGYLVVAVVLYSVILTAAMILIARHLTSILEDNKRAEAQLRSIGAHLRATGEGTERTNSHHDGRRMIRGALNEVILQWMLYCWQMMRMTLVSHTNTLLTPVIGLLLCTPKFISGSMTLGEVVQAAAAFAIVQGAFNWISDSYSRLAEWTSSANRVSSLLLGLDQIGDPEEAKGPDMSEEISTPHRPQARARK